MKKILKSIIIALTTTLITFSSVAFAENKLAEPKVVVVEGEAAITNSAVVAEQSAVAAALRAAVEQVSGVYVMSETKVKNFQTLSDEIYTKAEGYISDQEVISKQVKKDSVVVKVRATVSLEPLVDKLKKLGLLRKWTVAVVMYSKDSEKYDESASTAINEKVLENGFRVVDQDVLSSIEKPEVMNELKTGNYLAASRILRDNAVDVLIIGKANTEDMAGSTYDAYGVSVHLGSAKGRIEAKLVRTDTGEMLATKSFEGLGVGSGKDIHFQALKNSATEAGSFFVKEIMKLPASTASYIQVYVKGLSFSKAKSLVDALKSVRGIRKVTSKGFRNKEAIYEIETDGDANLLADNMSESNELSKNFKFDITTVSSGKIEANAK